MKKCIVNGKVILHDEIVEKNIFIENDKIVEISQRQPFDEEAVSYTHLDVYKRQALSPSEVVNVDINENDHSALVIVPDNQLSLAIGKKGQNARLAVRLTGWKIDIKDVYKRQK